MPRTTPLPLPGMDTLRIARLHNALYGGHWADGPERAAAEEIGRMYPATRKKDASQGGAVAGQMTAARLLHARAATWAVTAETDTARGVVFAACGYPCDPDPHTEALARAPLARFVFADLDPGIVLVNRAGPGREPGVSACQASARDPEGLLRHPAVQEIGGPIQLQVQLAAHWWPPSLARQLVAAYARLLPPRSTFILSLGVPVRSGGGEKFAAMLEETAGVPVYGHGEDEIASWVTDAGLELPPRGVKAVRAHGRPWAAMLGKAGAPGRIVYVSARKP